MAWVLARAAGRYGRVCCYRGSEFRQSAIECGKYRNSPRIVSNYINLGETPLECQQWGKHRHSPESSANYKVPPLKCQLLEQHVKATDERSSDLNKLKKTELLEQHVKATDERSSDQNKLKKTELLEQHVKATNERSSDQNKLKKTEEIKNLINAMDFDRLNYAKKLIEERLGTNNGQSAEFLYLVSRMDKVLVQTNSMQEELNKISSKKGDITSVYIDNCGYLNWLTVLMVIWKVSDAWPQLVEKISG